MLAPFFLITAIAIADTPTLPATSPDQDAPVGKLVGNKIIAGDGTRDRSVRIPKPWKQVDAAALEGMNRSVWEVQLVVQGIVEKDGTVTSIEPADCKVTSGNTPRPPGENAETCTSAFEVSKDAFAQWRYHPATRDGVLVRVYVTQKFYVKCKR